MIKPDISIFASAHRPPNWLELYNSIGNNNITFELVFVGPNYPDFTLPDNFIFIKSNLKPTQCIDIAIRNTSSDLIMNIADDCFFETKRPLDKLYDGYKKLDNPNLLFSCRYSLNGEIQPVNEHRFFIDDENSPIMPLAALMTKKLYFKIGGIDKNFLAIMWDLDLAMRVYKIGGEVILSEVVLREDKTKNMGSLLCDEHWSHDRTLLEYLWTSNRTLTFDRKEEVKSFRKSTLYYWNQGPGGKWGLFNKIALSVPQIMRISNLINRLKSKLLKKIFNNF